MIADKIAFRKNQKKFVYLICFKHPLTVPHYTLVPVTLIPDNIQWITASAAKMAATPAIILNTT
jgi:hypothetical protein